MCIRAAEQITVVLDSYSMCYCCMQTEAAASAIESSTNKSTGATLERLQEERVLLELRLASVEDRSTEDQHTTEQHIHLHNINEDIERVEREAEAVQTTNQVRCCAV